MDTPLSLATLGQLDAGNAGNAIEFELARMVEDIDKRGSDFKKRKLVVELTVWIDEKSEEMRIICKAQAKLPPRETREVPAATRKQQGVARLLFDDLEGGEAAGGGDAA